MSLKLLFEFASYHLTSAREGLMWLILSWANNADPANKMVQTSVFVIGGLTAYIRFVAGQTLTCRVDVKISGEVVTVNGLKRLKVTVEAKNIGTTTIFLKNALRMPPDRLPIPQESEREYRRRCKEANREYRRRCKQAKRNREPPPFESIARVLIDKIEEAASFNQPYPLNTQGASELGDWCRFEIFLRERCLRPNETLQETHMCYVPDDLPEVCRLGVRIVGGNGFLVKRFFAGGEEVWNQSTIVNLKDSAPKKRFRLGVV